MALTITEQLDILKGTVVPADAASDFNLEALVRQVSINEAQEFYETAKRPDNETQVDAFNYEQALYTVSDLTLTTTKSLVFLSLSRIIIAVYADTGQLSTVVAADTDAWVSFIENNIRRAFELYSGVKSYQKEAYEALP